MKQSLLTYFAWISVLLIIATSCRSARISYPDEQGVITVDSVSAILLEKTSFRTKVSWGEKELTGLMMVKKDSAGDYRIAFFNELGMTYLEGKLDRSSKHQKLNIINIAPAVNYKPFIKNFGKCLDAIFPRTASHPGPNISLPSQNSMVVRLRNGFAMQIRVTL
jgi:hypothetical protein